MVGIPVEVNIDFEKREDGEICIAIDTNDGRDTTYCRLSDTIPFCCPQGQRYVGLLTRVIDRAWKATEQERS